MREDVVLHRNRALVPRKLVESLLVVNNEEHYIVLVDAIVDECYRVR